MSIPMPPAAGPDPGQPGHFAHHDWLEQSVLALDQGAGLPGPQSGQGNVNTITATVWTALPTTPLSVDLDLPAPAWVLLNYGAWMAINTVGTSGDVRLAIDVSGATVIPAGPTSAPNEGEDVGWGDLPYMPGTEQRSSQKTGTRFIHANPGITTFRTMGMRSGNGGVYQINYPTLRVIPLWFG